MDAKRLELEAMAHRYLYWVLDKPVITDQAYDDLERMACKVLPASSPLHGVGSSRAQDYTEAQKVRAYELLREHRDVQP